MWYYNPNMENINLRTVYCYCVYKPCTRGVHCTNDIWMWYGCFDVFTYFVQYLYNVKVVIDMGLIGKVHWSIDCLIRAIFLPVNSIMIIS